MWLLLSTLAHLQQYRSKSLDDETIGSAHTIGIRSAS